MKSPLHICKPKKLTKLENGSEVFLQWISEPKQMMDGRKMPIYVHPSSQTIYMVWNKEIGSVNTDLINFVIYHEIGHIVLGHYDRSHVRDERQEDEADAYARQKVGDITFNKKDVEVFCRWFGNTCGKPEKITAEYISNQCKRFGI